MEERWSENVTISAGDALLPGDLTVPATAAGVVVFAHGSGSSRFSSRNRFVAEHLNQRGLATLLFDLLTPEEHQVDVQTAQYRFDIPRLADRLAETVSWLSGHEQTGRLRIGLFGASTGAAAALIAAARRPESIVAVVSRGGRPDLAGEALQSVRAATLLIVGGDDQPVIRLNQEAQSHMSGPCQLEIVPGATHLFAERGKLEEVARLASEWFCDKLAAQ